MRDIREALSSGEKICVDGEECTGASITPFSGAPILAVQGYANSFLWSFGEWLGGDGEPVCITNADGESLGIVEELGNDA